MATVQTMKYRVLSYLHTGLGITASEAKSKFACRNLRATISDIKERVEKNGNWRIVTEQDPDGSTRYNLMRVVLMCPTAYRASRSAFAAS